MLAIRSFLAAPPLAFEEERQRLAKNGSSSLS
jgi:hypothetical protein